MTQDVNVIYSSQMGNLEAREGQDTNKRHYEEITF